MSIVKLSYRADKSLQYRVDEMLILSMGFITINRDDWTVKHSPFAKALFQNPLITEFTITDAPAGQFMTIRSNQTFTKEDEQSFVDFIDASVKHGPLLDEEAIIAEANAVPAVPSLEKDFENAVADYVQNTFVPFIAKQMGHKAGMEFIRFYKDKDDSKALMAGITLRNACSGCSASVLGTLRQLFTRMNGYIQNSAGEEANTRVSGFIVLPDAKGSPSFSFKPPAAPAAKAN